MPTPQQEAEITPGPPKITVLVVSHQRAAMLRRSIEALERSRNREQIEILVVDNGGGAQLESELPGARFIRLPRNFGLTKALNIGVRAAAGEFILFLHDDIEVSPEVAAELAFVLETQAEVGAACPRLVLPDGSPAPQVTRFPGPGATRLEWRAVEPGPEGRTVECARGAAIMVRSFFLRALRQIDERYGQSCGDVELCFQVRRAGKKVVVLGSVQATDHGSGDAGASRDALRRADLELGMAVYLGKHFGFLAGLSARLLAIVRAFGMLLSMRGLGYQFALFRHVWNGQKIDGTQREQ